MHRRPGYHRIMAPALREPTFLLLTALTSGRQHGYALIGRVADLSQSRVLLTAGTLYGALDRLTDEGLVAEDGDEVVGGRLRRYYVLTDAGAAVLQDEVVRVRSNATAAARGLRARGATA